MTNELQQAETTLNVQLNQLNLLNGQQSYLIAEQI
jgi:hypothetical protein